MSKRTSPAAAPCSGACSWTRENLRPDNHFDYGCPTNLPGHYHCAKGKTFKTALEEDQSFEAELRHIVTSGQYNNTRAFREDDPIDQHNLWCAEELRSSRAIRRSIFASKIKFTGLSLEHGIGRITGDRLDKSMFDGTQYACDQEKLKAGGYVDLHCVRPFRHYLDEQVCQIRWQATEKVLQLAGML